MISQEQRVKIGKLVSEEHRNCINCVYFGLTPDNEKKCVGGECRNWDKGYTKDCFVPDDDYILDSFADCDNCANYVKGFRCWECSRAEREDLWEWGGGN